MDMGAGLHFYFSGNVMLHVLLLLGAGLHFVTTGSVRTSTSLFLVLCVRTRGQHVHMFSYSALGEKKGIGGKKASQEVTEKWMSIRDEKGEHAWTAYGACYFQLNKQTSVRSALHRLRKR